MKVAIKYFFFIFFSAAIVHGQSLELQLASEKNCSDHTYCVDIQLKISGAVSSSLVIGTSSMLLTYDEEVAAFKSYEASNFNDASLCNGWLPQRYDAISRRGEIEITLVLEQNGNTCPSIGSDLLSVGTVCFGILQQGASPNIRFDLNHTQFNTNDVDDGSVEVAVSAAAVIDANNILNCDCPGSGQTCDDGNIYTTNDRYDVFCHCIGQYLDSDGDGILDGVDPCLDEVYEAEDALIVGGAVENNEPQYSGTGFVEYDSNTDDFIEFDLNIAKSGIHKLSFRYALEGGNRPLELTIDGNLADPALEFPMTGSWATWDTIYIFKFLNAGTHKIRLTTIGQNGSYIDQLILSTCTGCNETGKPCNDNNPCTTDDALDANCNCGGKYEDSDFDGVCNESDLCEGHDDLADADGDGLPDGCDNCDNALIGTPCDDNDPCTENDVYIADCQCLGIFMGDDSDGDGVCDEFDVCPAGNDAFDADGDGIPDACDDCDERQIGMPCDDGDPCTLLDIVTPGCGCNGFFFDADGDGVCAALDQCSGFDDSIDNDGDGIPDPCDEIVVISPKMEIGKVSGVGDDWRTINLVNTYQSMVVVSSVVLAKNDQLPVVTRITSAVGSSFQIRVQNPSGKPVGGYNVEFVVAEEGIYTEAEDGFKMEARKELSVETAWPFHYEREPRPYLQPYSHPVVVGQVMTYNDPRWSVFWSSRHDEREEPADSTGMSASKQVVQDTIIDRLDETIGFLVIEAGNYFLDGLRFEARLGENTVIGTEDSATGSFYELNIGAANHAVISNAGMNSGNGGWPVLFGFQPHQGNRLYLAIDEDQIKDEERSHDEEQVAYLAFEITHPLSVVSIGATPVTCNGMADGSASVMVSGGEEPYQYFWSNGDTTATLDSLPAGEYHVTVVDANGTELINTAIVGHPPIISATLQGTGISCFGENDGQVSVSSEGGIGQHNYQWSNGQTSSTIDSLPPTEYTVTLTDEMGCTLTKSYEVTEPEEVTIAATATDITCFDGMDGTVETSITGAIGNQPTFTWSHGDSTQNLTGLIAGIYAVTVADDNNCTATTTIEVIQPDLLELETSATFTSCNDGDDATAIVTSTGGTGMVNFVWSNGDTGPTSDSLNTGIYNVTATDSNGCKAVASVLVTDPAMLAVEVESEDPTCANPTGGTATSVISGGTGNIDYLWSNGDTTSVIDSLMSGSYSITVTDANGCTATSVAEIFDPVLPTVEMIVMNPTCTNIMNGRVEATVTNGSGSYTYHWSTGDTTSIIEDLEAGSYEVTVTGLNGCTGMATAEVSDPIAPPIAITAINPSCSNAKDGSLEAIVTGGQGDFTFYWNTGDTTSIIDSLGSGVYTVTATDSNGCMDSAMAEIIAPFPLDLSLDVFHTSCQGTNLGGINASTSGGTGNFSYLWSTGDTTATISDLFAGEYSVTVTDENGCDTIAVDTVFNYFLIFLNPNVVDARCHGAADGIIDVSPFGGSDPYQFQWSGNVAGNESAAYMLEAGTYYLTVTDSDGCEVIDTFQIGQPDGLQITVDSVMAAFGDNADGAINISVTGGVPDYSFQWFFENNLVSEVEDPTDLLAGEYTLIVSDSNSCDTTLFIIVERVTSIEERLLSQSIRLTPNPTTGLFSMYIDLPETLPVTAAIFDVSGKVILADVPVVGRYDFDLTSQAAGVYSLWVKVGEVEVAKRVVVIH